MALPQSEPYRYQTLTGTDIETAAQWLREGHLVAIPTETVYGLAANGLDSRAVAEIFRAKNRPAFDPLILHTDTWEKASRLVKDIPQAAHDLAAQFWPGPLTLVLPKQPIIPDLVTSGLPRVAIRVPAHPLTAKLLAMLEFPLAAPSANPFGFVSPTTAQHVADQLSGKLAYILDGGPAQLGLESTIVAFDAQGKATVLRKGGLPLEDLHALVPDLQVQAVSSSRPEAPGMLKKHYAPKVPLLLGDIPALLQAHQGKSVCTLSFQTVYEGLASSNQFVLSASGDMAEAAHNLFAYLRLLDSQAPELILAELLPERGLGLAINDRLRRAAASHEAGE